MDYKKLLDPEKLKKDFESSRMKTLAYEIFVNCDEIFLLPSNQFKVYIYIYKECCHQENFEDGAIITIETFCEELGVSRDTIRNAIKSLIASGHIKSKVSHKFGNRYFVI